jgi:cytochrome c oxidase cbb3-type subunit III
MSEQSQQPQPDQLLDHEYDGIQEYDNPLPRWWVYIFWASIAFSAVYYFLPGDLGHGGKKEAMYAAEMARWEETRAAQGGPAGPDVAALTALVSDAGAVASGQATYVKYCQACHAEGGAGQIGPNLADAYWLHGGTPEAVWTTIANGVLAKGMPAWQQMLPPEDLDRVTAYVLSLQGTSPANPKAPEGDKVGP